MLVLGDFYSWEILEMLVRFTTLFFIYAFCVFFLVVFFFAGCGVRGVGCKV